MRNNSNPDPTRIILRFSRQHNVIKDIVHKHWIILTDDPRVNTFVSTNPLITYKRATSIKHILIQSEFKNEQKGGNTVQLLVRSHADIVRIVP